jgi:hypothetical protein
MRTWGCCLVWLVAASSQGWATSVIDPPVTLKVEGAPLSEVLAALTRQTGTGFQYRGRPERAPTISLAVERLPLRQVLQKLREQTTLAFWPGGWPPGEGHLAVAPPLIDAQPDRRVLAEVPGYRLCLTSVAAENTAFFPFGLQPVTPARRALQLQLAVDASTVLLRHSLLGLDPACELVVDGQALRPLQLPVSGRLGLPSVLPPLAINDREHFRLGFAHAGTPVTRLDTFAGALVICPAARERVFEFADQGILNQKLTDGDVDVNLVRWGPVQPGNDATLSLPGGQRPAGWIAEIEVAQPTDEPLQAQPAAGGPAPGRPGAAGAADGQREGARELAERLRAESARLSGELVLKEATARQLAPTVVWFGTSHVVGLAQATVVAETANGRVLLGRSGTTYTTRQGADGRTVTRFTMALAKDAGEPKRLLVGVFERGSRVQRVPFAFRNVVLPSVSAKAAP